MGYNWKSKYEKVNEMEGFVANLFVWTQNYGEAGLQPSNLTPEFSIGYSSRT